jgi:hypothetical protein
MKFISRYSNNKEVSAAQYITELICEKRAKIEKKDLHYRFWLNKEWSSYYRNQIATANKLVTKYNPIAIVKALQDSKTNNTYSLRAPLLKSIIEQHQKILDSQNKEFSKTIDRSSTKTFKKNRKYTKGIISKLEEIEQDEQS